MRPDWVGARTGMWVGLILFVRWKPACSAGRHLIPYKFEKGQEFGRWMRLLHPTSRDRNDIGMWGVCRIADHATVINH